MVLKLDNQCTSNGAWSVLNCPTAIGVGGCIDEDTWASSLSDMCVFAVEEHMHVAKR